MTRLFNDPKLVIASHNQGKIREFGDLFQPYSIEVVSSAELGLTEPEETGSTFAENALIKARSAMSESGLPALSDDSGLAVHALGGDPGIYSARWAGPTKDFSIAMEKINDALGDAEDRSAHFVAALALAWPDGEELVFQGEIHGTLVWPPRGDRGFGYDPMFLPEGGDETFGEMEPDAKHAISHRAIAFAKLIAACFTVAGNGSDGA